MSLWDELLLDHAERLAAGFLTGTTTAQVTYIAEGQRSKVILTLEAKGLLQHEERMTPEKIIDYGPTASPRIRVQWNEHAPDCRACSLLQQAKAP